MTKLTARPYVQLTIKQKCKCEHKYEKNYTWCKYFYTSKQLLFDTLSLHLKIVIIKVQARPGQADPTNCYADLESLIWCWLPGWLGRLAKL